MVIKSLKYWFTWSYILNFIPNSFIDRLILHLESNMTNCSKIFSYLMDLSPTQLSIIFYIITLNLSSSPPINDPFNCDLESIKNSFTSIGMSNYEFIHTVYCINT